MHLLDLVEEFVTDRQKLALDLQSVVDGYTRQLARMQKAPPDADVRTRLLAGSGTIELQSRIHYVGGKLLKNEQQARVIQAQATASLRSRVSKPNGAASRASKVAQQVRRLL